MDTRFTTELNRLYKLAGAPPHSSVASSVERGARLAGTQVPDGLRIRFGTWLKGTRPQKFDGPLRLVLADLRSRAKDRGADAKSLLTMSQWKRIWESSAPEKHSPVAACPYPGLASYGTDDAEYFCGREPEIEAVVNLTKDVPAGAGRLVAIVGVSGSGKSSLLAAGVIPRLADDHAVIVMAPDSDPYAALATALDVVAPITDLDDALRAWATARRETNLLLVIDQAEELFTECSQEQRDRFLNALDHCLHEGVGEAVALTVLVGVRQDFLTQWLGYAAFRTALSTSPTTSASAFVLDAMSREAVARAIALPAEKSGLTLGEGFVDMAIADLCGPASATYPPGSLPLLNHALAAAWARRKRNRLTIEGWREVGGVAGALTETAESAWTAMSPGEKSAAQRILLALVHLDEGGAADTRRTRDRAELVVDEDSAAALRALTDAHLVVVDRTDRVTVTHEILLTAWDRLKEWIAADRDALWERQKLHDTVDRWAENGRESHHLLRGAQLERANALFTAADGQRVEDCLAASNADARKERNKKRLQKIAYAAAVAVLLGATLVTWRSYLSEESQKQSADLASIQAQSDRLQLTDPSTAAQLALLAKQRDGSAENVARVRAAGGLPLSRATITAAGQIYCASLSPRGDLLAAAGGADQRIHLWKRSKAGTLHDLSATPGHTSFVTAVAWSPDNTRLVSTSDDQTVRIWTLDNGTLKQDALMRGHNSRVVMASWSPDGQRIATAGYDNAVRIWNTQNGNELAVLRGHTAPVRTVAWSPDSRTIAAGADNGMIRLWDAQSSSMTATIHGHADVAHSVAWSPDSALLVTGSDDTTVKLWDTHNRHLPSLRATISAHTGPVWSAVISPNSQMLLTTSLDGTTKIWQITDPTRPYQIGQTLAGAPGAAIYTGVWTPGSDFVLTGGGDGAIRSWSLPPTVLASHIGRARPPAIHGDRIATAVIDGSTGIVTLWSVRDVEHPSPIATIDTLPSVTSVDIAHDGLIAAGTSDSTYLLAARDGGLRPLARIPSRSRDMNFVRFSPDGRWLLSQRDDYTFQIWDVRDPASPKPGPVLEDSGTKESARLVTAAWTHDGRHVVTAGGGKAITLWDFSSRTAVHRVDAQNHGSNSVINAVATSTRGVLAVGGESGALKLWEIRDGKLTPLTETRYGPRQHAIRSLTFVDDGQRLVAAGAAQTVSLWDTHSPTALSPIGSVSIPGGHTRWYAAAPAAGNLVVVAGDAGALQIIRLDHFAERRICAHTEIDKETWQQYVPPGIEFDPPCKRMAGF